MADSKTLLFKENCAIPSLLVLRGGWQRLEKIMRLFRWKFEKEKKTIKRLPLIKSFYSWAICYLKKSVKNNLFLFLWCCEKQESKSVSSWATVCPPSSKIWTASKTGKKPALKINEEKNLKISYGKFERYFRRSFGSRYPWRLIFPTLKIWNDLFSMNYWFIKAPKIYDNFTNLPDDFL